MKIGKYILSVDQGTTSSRAVLFDTLGGNAGMGQKEFTQIYPKPGYVEHNAVEILDTTLYAMRQAVEHAGIKPGDIAGISITNQRETTVAWDRKTGIPICNAIVWQCRRTAAYCEELKAKGMAEYIRDTTGLIIDPYFSGTKMRWIMEHIPAAKQLAAEGRLCLGTIDAWLVFSLTDGGEFVTDVSNASRTMLFDIHKLQWDARMLEEMQVPISALPQVVSSSGVVGMCREAVLGMEIPIAGIAGDQHAALFGQCCFDAGMVKNTYGTGCFILMNTGDHPVKSDNGLLTTIGWMINGKVTYALEGSAFNAGSTIQWLRDELGMIKSAQECDMLAESVADTGGAAFVPAFTGLGAPYWDMYARGMLIGVTRGTGKAHICRAVLESIAFESCDLFTLMEEEAELKIRQLRVDGGASRSSFLMQYQADLLNLEVCRPVCMETTALGSAMLAGLALGVWESIAELRCLWKSSSLFRPNYPHKKRQADLMRWKRAVDRCRNWIDESTGL